MSKRKSFSQSFGNGIQEERVFDRPPIFGNSAFSYPFESQWDVDVPHGKNF